MPHRYAAGKRQLTEAFGLRVIDAPHATADPGWLHDHPQARAQDLHWALENPDVHGIISVIGGNDSIRLLPYLDFDLIRHHPKVFTGYSDTTVAHLIHRAAGVGSFYGMAVLSTAAENAGMHPFTVDSFRRTVMTAEPVGALNPAPEWTEERLDWLNPELQQQKRRWVPNYGWLWLQGSEAATGPIIGGCLESLTMTLGTPIFPELTAFDGAVLHLELSEEKPPIEQVAHWLRGFAAIGIIERIAALVFSRPEDRSLRETLELYTAVRAELIDAGRPELPFVANLDYGHSSPMGVLPLGRRMTVDPVAQRLSIDEAAVA
jgi:muramoyltetrapeptide carboxypeptidase LdcA involved in peptidoglycan recycling